ncbi:hypothetical protein JY96_18020 [Aquabacterium sp. NJ1]|uniref:HAMP domain-containing sensor histidine kinase n=1 Tax=Aquabacterium sp. NJ1 TaxID=1538295 RepID=UPI00052E3BBB|nr:ATP-binding protein [Aquabacterium sp. NJ1]KGM41320.1 hypothetical protein JY96_18020 [Aquabacterium sp. NJ1]
MKWRFWRGWGIAARLLAVAVLPASLMFVAVTGTLYVTARGDVHRDVAERGRLIATALSQSSQYGLVSGNVDYLRSTLHQVLHADPSILCISISNVQREVIASECQARPFKQSGVYDMPVRIESLPDTDQFEPPSSNKPARTDASLRTVGHVRVTVSATPIFEARRQALLLACALVLGAAIASCLIGMWLAGRLRQTLSSVMGALRSIRTGHFDVQLDADHPGELGELQRTILQMADTLDAARHDLEQQVISRTKELQEAVKRIQQADAEKRRLITHSNARVEEDRRRVALDIHDHLGAALISVRLEAAALVAKAQASGDEDTAKGARRIAATAESLYASTRDIVKSLRPEVIDTLGLAGAVEEMVRGHDKVHPRCRFSFSEDLALTEVPAELAMPAYRVVQEALNNIVKHADATEASVQLGLSRDKRLLCIEIKDNGRGFDTSTSNQSGLGLIGMRERVAAVGGELCISSPRGQGTTIYVTLPLSVDKVS